MDEWLRGDDEPDNSGFQEENENLKNKIRNFHIHKHQWLPISPFSLELDSVKLGVPSVHVGVEPSIDAGGVQARAPLEP